MDTTNIDPHIPVIGLFFIVLVTIIVLVAAPWHAPTHVRHMSHPLLIVLAALIQIPVLLYGRPPFGPLLGAALIIIWTLRNRHLPGAALLLIGVTVNTVAMLSHGGMMPLDPNAGQALGLAATPHSWVAGSKDVIGQANSWRWLGDWIKIQTPFITIVGSPGDIGILAAVLRWASTCRIASFNGRGG